MLRANKRKKHVYMETSLPRIEINHLVFLSFALLMIICLYPEISLAKEVVGLETQLTKVTTLIQPNHQSTPLIPPISKLMLL